MYIFLKLKGRSLWCEAVVKSTYTLHAINMWDYGIYNVHVWEIRMKDAQEEMRDEMGMQLGRFSVKTDWSTNGNIWNTVVNNESIKTTIHIYSYFIYISFLGGYLVHQISHWQLSAFNVFRSQKQSLGLTNTNTK